MTQKGLSNIDYRERYENVTSKYNLIIVLEVYLSNFIQIKHI